MTTENLNGLKVAILVTDGFEQVELTEPRKALDQAGARTQIVSPKDGQVRGWKFTDWGENLPVDVKLDGAKAEDFDALLLPGGVMNPDELRTLPKAVAFAKAFLDAGKPVASICTRPLDDHRNRRGARAAPDLVALAQDRSAQRRRGLGGPGGRRGSKPGHEPQA
jgi:protease I